jgi:serine/threonine protein kinase
MDGHVSVDYRHVWIVFTDILLIVQIIKVLGEGGFSFVYLAQDEHSGVCSDNCFGSSWHAEVQRACGLAAICIEENTVSNGSTRS